MEGREDRRLEVVSAPSLLLQQENNLQRQLDERRWRGTGHLLHLVRFHSWNQNLRGGFGSSSSITGRTHQEGSRGTLPVEAKEDDHQDRRTGPERPGWASESSTASKRRWRNRDEVRNDEKWQLRRRRDKEEGAGFGLLVP